MPRTRTRTRAPRHAAKCLARTLWITLSFCGLSLHAQEGGGCGHTMLGPESGTLASANYPGTYPQDAWCSWTLRVPPGRTLRLVFGDLDIETSVNCSNGSLMIIPGDGAPSIGPRCGGLAAPPRDVLVRSSNATVVFRSGAHRSGRGFLLSYTTDQFPEIISCLKRGTHFSPPRQLEFSVFCPAGCKDVSADVAGNSEQGYRDTSPLCKAAVHGGVVSDRLGGRVSVTRGKGLRLYESTFANGVLSTSGSLSEHKLLFSKECNDTLSVSLVNSSSLGGPARPPGSRRQAGPFQTWTAEPDDQDPWVELDLGDKRTVTGIITTGSERSYIQSYTLDYRDRKKDKWKPYKGAPSKEKKAQVFEAHHDGHLKVLNSLLPPMAARFVLLKPRTWESRATVDRIQLLGCAVVRANRTSSAAGGPKVTATKRQDTAPVKDSTPSTDATVVRVSATTQRTGTLAGGETVLVKDSSGGQPAVLVVAVVLGLAMCVGCLLAGFWWKRRRKKAQMERSPSDQGPVNRQSVQGKSQGGESELISHPLESRVPDTLPGSPLSDYAEPGAGGLALGSTFRPAPFSLGRYRAPGSLPEYAQPLPPEPEYATPFSEQLPEGRDQRRDERHGRRGAALPPPPPPPPPACGEASPGRAHYDCPSHRVLSNGYCTPTQQGPARRADSVVYSEPEPSYSLLQEPHTYEELL